MTFAPVALFVLALGALAGCRSGTDERTQPPPVSARVSAPVLDNSRWRIVSVDGQRAEPRSTMEFLVEPDGTQRLSGTVGCNRFSAGYGQRAERLHVAQIVATQMACTRELAQTEAVVAAILQSKPRVVAQPEGFLEIIAPDGRRLLLEAR